MIVGDYFSGDNITVAWYQHDVYHIAIGIIIGYATDSYLSHARSIGLDDDFTELLSKIKLVDHRPFQYFHDLIAAFYRFKYCRQYSLALEGFDAPQNKQEWQKHWLSILQSEITELLESGFGFDLASLILLYHTDYGYVLENRLLLRLADHYKEEASNFDAKGVDLLDENLRKDLLDKLEGKPILDRNGVLELVRKNRELIEEGIGNRE